MTHDDEKDYYYQQLYIRRSSWQLYIVASDTIPSSETGEVQIEERKFAVAIARDELEALDEFKKQHPHEVVVSIKLLPLEEMGYFLLKKLPVEAGVR